jgi:hypothetical protein
VEAARGAAANFMAPEDMKPPKPVRPRPKAG